jgi:hypothetical protein
MEAYLKRRDLSKILLASSATSVLAMRNVVAQACNAPCYTSTAAEIAAGVTPTNTAYPQGDVRRYGADPTGVADSTIAIQDALNVGQAVYIASGQYVISASLTNSVANRRIYGDGPSVSVLLPTGAIDTIVNTAPLSCVLMDNFGILGNSTTLDGITQLSSVPLYESRFENLAVWVGGRAFYLPGEFNTQLINCQASSYNANVFELNGGNTTLLQGCYAHQVPAGCYGYRIYASAHLDSCNGIDSSTGDWGLFGAYTGYGDPVNANFAVILTNCNVEGFNNTGLRFRTTGFARVQGGAITAKASGTYWSEVYVEYTEALIVIENVSFYNLGATRTALAPIYCQNDSNILMIGPCTAPQYDWAGMLITLPIMSSSYPSYLQRAININSLDVAQLYSRYAGTAVLSGGIATVTFTIPQPYTGYQVMVTGNASEIFSVANKTVSGFTIQSSNPSSTASVDWMLLRTGT